MGHVIDSPSLPDSVSRYYSQARVERGTLYVSGQVGWDASNDVVADDIKGQTRRALENVGHILEAVDRGYEDIVKVTSYFTDIERDFGGYKAVWSTTFEEPYPCHTAIGVAALAEPELLVELEFEVPLD